MTSNKTLDLGPMSLYKIKTDMRYSNNLYLLILQKGKEGGS